jgi:hypothetical protein
MSSKPHDLQQYLSEVAARLERFPASRVTIGWVAPKAIARGCYNSWAMLAWPTENHDYVIAISIELLHAPKYVLRSLVLHECLHIVLPPRGKCQHHYAFRQAERSNQDFKRAWRWLQAAAAAPTQ